MPRLARIVIPGLPHHVTQRGNNRQDVFFVDDDRWAYLDFLKRFCGDHGVTVQGYCLMTNHVHLILTPPTEEAFARALGVTHHRYAQYVNALHGRSGHLWQNRFYSCPMDESHLVNALRYVERNPVRAKLVRRAWRHPWSSALAHVNSDPDGAGLLDVRWWRDFARGLDWEQELVDELDDADAHKIRLATSRGRPLANDAFLAKLEHQLGRRLRPRPVGRPKKEKAASGNKK